MALTDNLVSYYKLDESSGNAADSVGGNTLTNVGTATFSAGKINNGANMASASNQYFTSANNAGIVGSNYSVFAWIKSTTNTEQVVIASSAGTGATLDGFFFLIAGDDTTNNLKFVEYNAGFAASSIADATGVFNDGNWHHVGFTVVADTTYNLYLDGRLLKTATVTARTTTDHPFYVGRYMHASSGYLNGSIDESGLWSRALSADEVSQLYNSNRGLGYPLTAPTLYGGTNYWKCDDVNDSISTNNFSNTGVTFSTGKIGNGAVFDSGHADLLDGTDVTPTSFAFWLNAVAMYNGTTGYNLFTNDAVGTTVQGQASTGKILIYDGSNRVATNTWAVGGWNHYVFVYDSSGTAGYNIYLNGSFLEKLTSNQVAIAKIGRTSAGSFSPEMTIDEIAFFNRALSTSEITTLYNAGAGLQYPWAVASGPANLKSYNTNLKANIKSINTNLIANVKSLNTNV